MRKVTHVDGTEAPLTGHVCRCQGSIPGRIVYSMRNKQVAHPWLCLTIPGDGNHGMAQQSWLTTVSHLLTNC